jgi:hypothetical protein
VLSFGNPLGFLALLGIPAVLAIHFLQQKSQRLPITTLFLLEQMSRESITGSRFERIRNSVPLWLQLLMVLALAWLITEPRWLRKDSVQRIAIVLDSSASMSVFKDKLISGLDDKLGSLSSLVNRTDYIAIDSRRSGERIYNGSSRAEMLDKIAAWTPLSGAQDVLPALRTARSLIGPDGMIVLATDQPQPALPFETRVLSVGSPIENCGFSGVTVDTSSGQPLWKALVRNYGSKEQQRTWRVEGESGSSSADRNIMLAAGATQTLQGPFPEGTERVTLVLQGDEFTLDDRMPIIRPQIKEMKIWRGPDTATNDEKNKAEDIYDKVFRSFERVLMAVDDTDADLSIIHYDPLSPQQIKTHACVFVADPLKAGKFMSGQIVAEGHPLMDGLNWQGLLCHETLSIPSQDTDQVLLWVGGKPMIFLRTVDGNRQLLFSFDLRKTNAPRLPAFIVLIHRFIEGIRDEKIAPESLNLESGQKLTFAFITGEEAAPLTLKSDAGTNEIPLREAALINAPSMPGFFEISQGEQSLILAAAHFSDTREADFRSASPVDELTPSEAKLIERHSQSQTNWTFWALLLMLVLLVSWFFTRPSAIAKKQEAQTT